MTSMENFIEKVGLFIVVNDDKSKVFLVCLT